MTGVSLVGWVGLGDGELWLSLDLGVYCGNGFNDPDISWFLGVVISNKDQCCKFTKSRDQICNSSKLIPRAHFCNFLNHGGLSLTFL